MPNNIIKDAKNIRIAKIISKSGAYSRRDAEKLIHEGKVELNGKTIDSPATFVNPKDKILVDGKIIKRFEMTKIWLLNKPKGYITSSKDPQNRKKVFDILPSKSTHTLDQVVNESDIIFISVPTPSFADGGLDNAEIARIREAGPAVWIEDPVSGVPFWAITQQSSLDFVSKNNHLFSSERRGAIPMEMEQEMVDNIQTRMFLNLDPPRNLEYRKLIRDHFSPAQVATYEPSIRSHAKRIVDNVIDRGECEFVRDVAAELPLLVILEFFDIPPEDRKKFFEWTNKMIFSEDPETVDQVDGQAQAEAAAAEMMFYAFELAKKWRGSDENNVSSQLLNGKIDGEPISDETFGWIVLMLISAGNEGRVAKSFPNKAEVSVNLVPTSCIPSPESPANLIVTAGIDSTVLFSNEGSLLSIILY